jgi:hypothetical protein
MGFTMPEGVPTPTPVSDYSLPQTLRFENPREPKQTSISLPAILVAISIVLGIVIATGTIVGVIGKAFYVQRDEYNQGVVKSAEEKVQVAETLKHMDQAIARQEASIEKISVIVESLRQDVVAARRR